MKILEIERYSGKLTRWHFISIVLLAVPLIGTIWAAYNLLPFASDWADSFRPAILKIFSGRSPYEVERFLNAPWILIPLIPFVLLPPQLSRAVLFVASLIGYAIAARRLKAKPLAVVALLTSYPIIYGLIYGQIDWLIALGITLSPPVGMFFVLSKPQIGIGIAIYWIVEAWRVGGWKKVFWTVFPVGSAFVISFILYGNWLVQTIYPLGQSWNTSLWPKSIPIGLVLLVAALQNRKPSSAIMASPFLSPYLAAHSWSIVLMGMLQNTLYTVVVSISMWGVWLLGGGPIDR